MTDKTDSKEREALRSIGEEQAFEAWFKVDCPVEGANAKIAAKAAWKARASLAASAGSEPVAWWYVPSKAWGDKVFTDDPVRAEDARQAGCVVEPLYLHPSPPEGMVGGWQDIATAPKDGTYLLLWEQYSTNPFVGCWAFGSWSVSHEHVDAEGGWDGANVVDSISQDLITHWMKLPESPYGKN
ncbi:DUF551 domain-containing protein [Acidovorax sp. K2F]|uniref:DUF551 domain-containing protein n=1 Tax=Acidovorax sp. K2F TaxID=2978125 RepID=UPI0021B0E098|nr:DUF551 domain-containing protein [Acidovorax sp. K2F]MCT6719802.1 DUF551 domain-containing protein [Acidovorax sp. K2F]